MAIIAAVGISLVLSSLKSGALFLYTTVGVTSFAIWVVIAKESERYGLVLLPLLALAAAWTLVVVARLVSGWFRLKARSKQAFRAALFVLVFGVSLRNDLVAVTRWHEPPGQTWLTEFRALGPSPGDLVMSDNPEIPARYLGRVYYWERGANYERYTFISGDYIRHAYTGAVKVGSEKEFLSLVLANRSKILWYLGDEPGLKDFPLNLRERIFRSAGLVRRTQDGMIIL